MGSQASFDDQVPCIIVMVSLTQCEVGHAGQEHGVVQRPGLFVFCCQNVELQWSELKLGIWYWLKEGYYKAQDPHAGTDRQLTLEKRAWARKWRVRNLQLGKKIPDSAVSIIRPRYSN